MSTTNVYRNVHRGQYETDFSLIQEGNVFPSMEIRERNACYRFYHRLYSGEYARNKKLLARVNSEEVEIPYKVIPINMFKLIVSKLDSLFFSNDISIKTGDIERDKKISALVKRTNFVQELRSAFKLAEINGDSCIKVSTNGISSFSPKFCYKVVDESNKSNVKAYVIHELLSTTIANGTKIIDHIRFEIHTKGKIFEIVFEYSGNIYNGIIGRSVKYQYKGRTIPKGGKFYKTGIDDCETIQWLTLNQTADGCYGQSSFIDVMDIVFAIESRLSSELWVEDNHEKPYLIIGSEMIVPNEETGGYELKQVNGKYFIGNNEGVKPEYLTWDGKLNNSRDIRADFLSYFYELSELGKTFLSGEYVGNISEETLNNTIKSAIDRGNRDLSDFYNSARDALYCMCKLNGIDINLEEITIGFNVGRSDDDKVVAEIIKQLHESKVFSMTTLREKYFGYNEEQSHEEDTRIANEVEISKKMNPSDSFLNKSEILDQKGENDNDIS